MTDLHVTRKDSSASDNSNENSACKLTLENLRLHDKLSSQAPPYSSLSRLEESPKVSETQNSSNNVEKTDEVETTYKKYSSRVSR